MSARTLALVSVVSFVVIACSSSDGEGSSGGSSGGSSSGASGSTSSSGASGSTSSSSGSTYSTAAKEGTATYYSATGEGNCGFPATPDDLDVAAFDDESYAGAAACGSCVKVTGPNGEVTVRIVDRCPGCGANHVDLSRESFGKIADLAAGRIKVTIQGVACDVTGPLQYHMKDGSSKYWTAIQVRNHRVPVAKVEYKKGADYVEMKRELYNYFVESSGVGDQPGGLVLRVTGADGQTVEDTLPGTIQSDATVTGQSQFR